MEAIAYEPSYEQAIAFTLAGESLEYHEFPPFVDTHTGSGEPR